MLLAKLKHWWKWDFMERLVRGRNQHSANVRSDGKVQVNPATTTSISSSNPDVPLLTSSSSYFRPARIGPKDEIRILDLLPGNEDDDIECDTRVVALSDGELLYEALSYVWGETVVGGKAVRVNGRETEITHNLHAALRQLRHPTRKRALWVDQLCINQWDNDEKAEQVSLMRLIYKRCSQCLIWLDEIIEEAAGFSIQDANNALDFICVVAAARYRPITALPTMLADSEESEGARKAFRGMVMHGNPWWSRIWTVQEIVLPVSATVLWGPLTIPWETLETAAANICLGGIPFILINALHWHQDLIGNFMYPVRGLAISRSMEGPLNLLQRWRYREATDPRDKVYALLGLLPHNHLPFPSIQSCSYNISPALLYSRVTLDLIWLERSLRPLVGFRGEPHVTPDLPTWALDLTRYNYGIKRRPWEWWKHSHRYKVFTSSGNRPLECASLSNDTVLSLKGVFVDKIVDVGMVLGEETWEDLSDGQLIQMILSWELLLDRFIRSRQAGGAYVGGGSWCDAFWRTMLGDLVMEEFPVRRAVNACRLEFHNFLQYQIRGSIHESLCDMVVNQAFFITANGYVGIGPPNIQVADEVWVLFGGRVPFVLRPDGVGVYEPPEAVEANERFFIGDTYVHGIMDGEAVKDCAVEEKTVLIC
jgi:hypothetical protein